MRLAALASLLTAGLIALAMAVAPMLSHADSPAASCSTCGKGKSTAPSSCPRCDNGKSCSSCKGDGYRGHHGTWGAHKWEYKCVRPGKKTDAMSQQFTAMGDQGWLLKEAEGGIWCFARMKPSK